MRVKCVGCLCALVIAIETAGQPAVSNFPPPAEISRTIGETPVGRRVEYLPEDLSRQEHPWPHFVLSEQIGEGEEASWQLVRVLPDVRFVEPVRPPQEPSYQTAPRASAIEIDEIRKLVVVVTSMTLGGRTYVMTHVLPLDPAQLPPRWNPEVLVRESSASLKHAADLSEVAVRALNATWMNADELKIELLSASEDGVPIGTLTLDMKSYGLGSPVPAEATEGSGQ